MYGWLAYHLPTSQDPPILDTPGKLIWHNQVS